MILNKLKQKNLKRNLEKSLETRDTSGINASVVTIGFLVNEADFQDFESLYDVFRDFNLQPKDVKVFSFILTGREICTIRMPRSFWIKSLMF